MKAHWLAAFALVSLALGGCASGPSTSDTFEWGVPPPMVKVLEPQTSDNTISLELRLDDDPNCTPIASHGDEQSKVCIFGESDGALLASVPLSDTQLAELSSSGGLDLVIVDDDLQDRNDLCIVPVILIEFADGDVIIAPTCVPVPE